MFSSVMLRRLVALFVLVVAAPLGAQTGVVSSGRIVGRVVDGVTGQGLPDVGVRVDGGAPGGVSGADGRFAITNVAPGSVTLVARRLGYQVKSVTGVLVIAGRPTEQNISLTAATRQLETQVVTASAERGTVADALDAQRNAPGIVSSVTSEQIAKSPDSDAAQAVQRVSGVTVQDGKYVFVRGLGERYTTTSLNGARIPSPEPERKVVPLDLFPSGVIQSITTSKTFTPDQSGDFSGAQVDIRTREFPAQRQAVFSMTSGVNPSAVGSTLPAPPTSGSEWIAFAGSGRNIPGVVQSAGDFTSTPSQEQFNEMVRSFRNVWTPLRGSSTPNGSFSASLGGNDPLLFGRTLGYLGSVTYSRGQEARADEVRANVLPSSVAGTVDEADRFVGSTGRSSVLAGGLLNLSTMLGTHSRLMLNNSYNRSSDNEARREIGNSEQFGTQFRIDRLRYVERSVRSSQLGGEHDVGRQHADWAGTASAVSRREPDRSEIVYSIDADGIPRWFGTSNEGAIRTFGDLTETSAEGRLNYRLAFADGPSAAIIKTGVLYRSTDRTAENRAYSITANGLTSTERSMSPEQIFGGAASASGSNIFRISPVVQGGSYSARDRLAAGYLMGEVNLGERIRLITGARVERSRVDLTAQSTLGNPVTVAPQYTDVLPSAAVNVKLTETQALRLSASQTLSRPEYRELAPVTFREVLGGDNVQGNDSLRRSLIRNADIRWEWYPDAGEVLSIGVFAKRFTDPIERVYTPTSGTRLVTFENSPTGSNLGLELEARKGLGFMTERFSSFTVSTNATVMRSAIRVTRADGITVRDRPMVGQAPYVVNAGLTYQRDERGLSTTVLFNTVGERIYGASEADLPDVYEQPRQVLDFSLRIPVLSGFAMRLDMKNLLDSPYEIRQGSVVRERYSAGRIFQAGVTWR